MSDPSSQSPAPGSGPLASNWSQALPEGDTAPPNKVDLHFDDKGGCYYRRDNRGGYIRANAADARRFLRTLGYSAKSEDGRASPLDLMLETIQTTQNCDYAAPLAGHKAGLLDFEGRRILVTTSPRMIDPVPGRWEELARIFNGLLGEEQCRWFYLWLKVAIEAIRHTHHRLGQALIVAGPANCGKNLLQWIITQLFGGRTAKPFRYLCGRSDFNAELFTAEHLIIQDEAASFDPRFRKRFGQEIKQIIANETQNCHGKGRDALNLPPIWRLSITVNDEPASLLVLPQIEEGLKDKLMLFRARAFKMSVDTSTEGGKEMLRRQIQSELPAFVHYLESLTIPEEMKDTRFGVRAYQNESLLDLMDAMPDEMKLLEMIDSAIFDSPQSGAWEGFARELEEKLRDVTGFRQLIPTVGYCGSLLGKLADNKMRVERLTKPHNSQRWRILPPSEE